MKDQISFVSGLFDTAPSVPPVANDHHFGEDVAVWMAGKSKDSEFNFGAPVRTPTGWAEPVTADGESFVLGFGLMDGYIGSDHYRQGAFVAVVGNERLLVAVASLRPYPQRPT
jgi:hypothetical protein